MAGGRHRSRRLPPALIIGSLAAVLAIGIGGLLFLRAGGLPDIVGPGPDDTVPAFEFELVGTEAVITGATDRSVANDAAAQAAEQIRGILTELYVGAFLDPGNWREETYDAVFSSFTGSVAGQAAEDAEVLTLGAGAGEAFDTVRPVEGTLDVRVLLDRRGRPTSAVAIVRFAADAAEGTGAVRQVISSGHYFLEPSGSGWSIVGYRIDRADEASPVPGPTGSPGETPS